MANELTAEELIPVTNFTPPGPVAEVTPAPEEGSGIPAPVLAIPAMRGLLEGKPAAVSVQQGVKTPETELVLANVKPLQDAGFGFYLGVDGKTGVLFNTQYLSENELKKADKAGKLADVAPALEEVAGSFDVALKNAAAGSQNAPANESGAIPAPAGGSVGPAPAGAVQARQQKLKTGGPTSGPYPGQGRILNSIATPVT
jgi:hypothetical protein